MSRMHAVGIVVRDRWDLTYGTLNSLYYADQDKSSYDLYVIDNGSSPEIRAELKNWLSGDLIPFRNLIVLKQGVSIPDAWNLFLGITKDYPYRTKLDNDLVFLGTPSVNVEPEPPSAQIPDVQPDAGVNPGAIPSASIIKSAGQWVAARHRKMQAKRASHSRFLDHMTEFRERLNADLVALAPVTPGVPFQNTYGKLLQRQENGMPYLVGGCMMISQTVFNTIGYFDEYLPREIDIDYSQRAIEAGYNIGYHDYYWAVHFGNKYPTEGPDMKSQRIQQAKQLIQMRGRHQGFNGCKWLSVIDAIRSEMNTNRVVNLQ